MISEMHEYYILAQKEAMLNEIITWLKAKGLFEEAMKDCPTGKGLLK